MSPFRVSVCVASCSAKASIYACSSSTDSINTSTYGIKSFAEETPDNTPTTKPAPAVRAIFKSAVVSPTTITLDGSTFIRSQIANTISGAGLPGMPSSAQTLVVSKISSSAILVAIIRITYSLRSDLGLRSFLCSPYCLTGAIYKPYANQDCDSAEYRCQ